MKNKIQYIPFIAAIVISLIGLWKYLPEEEFIISVLSFVILLLSPLLLVNIFYLWETWYEDNGVNERPERKDGVIYVCDIVTGEILHEKGFAAKLQDFLLSGFKSGREIDNFIKVNFIFPNHLIMRSPYISDVIKNYILAFKDEIKPQIKKCLPDFRYMRVSKKSVFIYKYDFYHYFGLILSVFSSHILEEIFGNEYKVSAICIKNENNMPEFIKMNLFEIEAILIEKGYILLRETSEELIYIKN